MFRLLANTNVPFMKHRRVAYALSGLLMLATVAWLVAHGGPRYGVEFTGGTLVQFRLAHTLRADPVRAALEADGFEGFELQQVVGGDPGGGHEFMVRFRTIGEVDPFSAVERAIERAIPGESVELRRIETIGPKVGRELRVKAAWAVLGSLGGILAYVGLRYDFKFALGAVVALAHDVIGTLGILCFAGREVSLTVVAALLTIAGFSINDTIVIFDRIRERRRSLGRETPARIMDVAVNETLSRTVITSLTVLFTSVALLGWGGAALADFSLAMVTGVLLGVYSTVYVAGGLALDLWIRSDRRQARAAPDPTPTA